LLRGAGAADSSPRDVGAGSVEADDDDGDAAANVVEPVAAGGAEALAIIAVVVSGRCVAGASAPGTSVSTFVGVVTIPEAGARRASVVICGWSEPSVNQK
jgi:hypothetical protein